MKYFKMHYLDIRVRPFLLQLLLAIKYSFVTLYFTGLAVVLKSILFDGRHESFSEIGVCLIQGLFIFALYYLPINIFILIIIQFTRIIPFIIYSKILVCLESIIFYISYLIAPNSFFHKKDMEFIIATIVIVFLSLICKTYLLLRHKKYYMAGVRTVKRSKKIYMINREVDVFFIIVIITISSLSFFLWI